MTACTAAVSANAASASSLASIIAKLKLLNLKPPPSVLLSHRLRMLPMHVILPVMLLKKLIKLQQMQQSGHGL
jgi:hypothetical protein